MKKIINENTIKSIVRESLKNYLKESMDINSSEGWTPEMDDMWDEFGDNNVHDTDANMRAYDDKEDKFISDDNTEYARNKFFESVIKRAVNEAFKKAVNNDECDFQDKSECCGDTKCCTEKGRKAKANSDKKPPKRTKYIRCGLNPHLILFLSI